MERVFNKLVRDNIPNINANNGEESVTRVLEEDEYRTELYKKLGQLTKNKDEWESSISDVAYLLK